MVGILLKGPNFGKKGLVNFILTCLRWTIIFSCFGIVINGWILSINKYISEKTSVSLVVNETDQFLFPSITFCTRMPLSLYGPVDTHAKLLQKQGKGEFTEEYFMQLVDNITDSKREFLDNLVDQNLHRNVARNDSYWTASTPSINTGKCHTYDPPLKSPINLAGINFWLKYPSGINGVDARIAWLSRTYIFLHDVGKFIYTDFIGQEMPNNVWLNPTMLKSGPANILTIKYSKMTSLDSKQHPCTSDESISFVKCFEKYFAARRGCQKPWHYFPEFGIEKCLNVFDVLELVKEDNVQSSWSAMERAKRTSCLLPCTTTIYDLQYNTVDDDINAIFAVTQDSYYAMRVNVEFKNFKFRYEEEYLICDLTCLIGEIGGNFGFFLGGSILTMYDLVYYKLRYASS